MCISHPGTNRPDCARDRQAVEGASPPTRQRGEQGTGDRFNKQKQTIKKRYVCMYMCMPVFTEGSRGSNPLELELLVNYLMSVLRGQGERVSAEFS